MRIAFLLGHRDTEDSAPAEFPPEQPEADIVEDDGATYGAEEEEELEEELKAGDEAQAIGEDEEMAGADDTAGPLISAPSKGEGEEDEVSDAGSEDLEAESSGSEDEEIEEEEGEGDGDEDMEMAEDGDHPAGSAAGKAKHLNQQSNGEVMVH